MCRRICNKKKKKQSKPASFDVIFNVKFEKNVQNSC